MDNWRKSKRSRANGGCAEVASGPGAVAIRDTRQAHLGKNRTVLKYSPAAWREFAARVKADIAAPG